MITKKAKKVGLNEVFDLNTLTLLKALNNLEFDILHIQRDHGLVSYLAFPFLTRKKPVIITLHAMWSFTGHCYYSYDCERWKIGCGRCPYPDIPPRIKRDATHLEWTLKKWAYHHSNLAIATPSAWLTELAKQSILNRFPIHHIPNGIDTEAYYPIDSEKSRFELGIPLGRKVLMFSAINIRNRRKGGDLLLKALKSLPESLKAETILLVMGKGFETIAESIDFQVLNMGFISDSHRKALCFSAADLFLCPSRADNLPVVLQESMACGTPMVSFRVGGIPDLVRPGITGYLAESEDVQDFRNGIVKLLEDDSLRNSMKQQCRAVALAEYSYDVAAQRYVHLYKSLLN